MNETITRVCRIFHITTIAAKSYVKFRFVLTTYYTHNTHVYVNTPYFFTYHKYRKLDFLYIDHSINLSHIALQIWNIFLKYLSSGTLK